MMYFTHICYISTNQVQGTVMVNGVKRGDGEVYKGEKEENSELGREERKSQSHVKT